MRSEDVTYDNAVYFLCSVCENNIFDLVIVLDSSGSITENNQPDNWDLTKEFVVSILQGLDISPSATRVGLVMFSRTVVNEFFLNTYSSRGDMINHVNGLT